MARDSEDGKGEREVWSTAVWVFRICSIIIPSLIAFLAVQFTGNQNSKDIEKIQKTLDTLISAPLSVQQNTKDIEELKASRTAMYAKMNETFDALDHKVNEVDLKLNTISISQAQIGQSVQDIRDGLREDRTRRNH